MPKRLRSKKRKMADELQAPSLFTDVELAAPIAVFQLTADYNADPAENKINLGVGAYRTEDGQPWVLPVVKSIEAQMAIDPLLNHEYLPVLGLPDFREAATELILGKESIAIVENRAGGVQSISGTGALCIAGEFLNKFYNKREASTAVYVSGPTWGNHYSLFRQAGFNDIRAYRYWDAQTRGLDMAGLVSDLENAPDYSIVILHACAHNPTGVDPTEDQWREIARICRERNLFPIFDCAYQGFASGDPDRDAFAVRLFVSMGFELVACQSFAKNFGIYNERAGNLTVVVRDASTLSRVMSQIVLIVRSIYSNPPNHGARVVATTLRNLAFRQEWLDNLRTMSDRIRSMRALLHSKLRAKGTPGNWDHVVNQIGMFCFTGLNTNQVAQLKKRHLYMLTNGRINMCALNPNNIDYFVTCVHEVVCADQEGKL